MRNSCHGKIHTNLCALTVEVRSQICKDVFGNALCHAYHVLCGPCLAVSLSGKLVGGRIADRAFLRNGISLVNITTYLTYKFHSINLLYMFYFYY